MFAGNTKRIENVPESCEPAFFMKEKVFLQLIVTSCWFPSHFFDIFVPIVDVFGCSLQPCTYERTSGHSPLKNHLTLS